MATDWVFYWMTRPSGLALLALAIALPFALWRAVLGKVYASVGFLPLAAAYASAMVGLVGVSFASSYFEFSSRVANGILPEAQRWPTVLGWSLYLAVLSLLFVLPLLGMVGVPLSALLVRLHRLSYRTIALSVVTLWLSMAIASWALPGNEWHRTHRLESLAMWLKDLLPGFLFVALPFLVSIRHLASRGSRHAGT